MMALFRSPSGPFIIKIPLLIVCVHGRIKSTEKT